MTDTGPATLGAWYFPSAASFRICLSSVSSAIEARGAELRFLPPYSPDLNPIEQVFAKLKNLVRAAAPRNVENLWNTIGQSLSRFSSMECANYIANSDYPRMM